MSAGRLDRLGALGGVMPERWLVPLEGQIPPGIEVVHEHAAVSHWFDHRPSLECAGQDGRSTDSHGDKVKDWSVSAPRVVSGRLCLVVGTLTESAAKELHKTARVGAPVVFGRDRFVIADDVRLLSASSWDELARPSTERGWVMEFLDPTSFTSGQRTSPLVTPARILAGLKGKWRPDTPCTGFEPPADPARGVWVSDIDGRSHVVKGRRPGAHASKTWAGSRTYSGFVGWVRLEVEEEFAAGVIPLLRLAPFSGVGAGTTRGLGTVQVRPGPRRG